MSVYSGFTTRHQEVTYNRLTETLLLLLQDRLLALQRHDQPTDRFWLEQFSSVFAQMNRMEAHKYFPPKLTQCVKDLAASHGLGEWEAPVNLSTVHHKAGTARHSYRRSVSPRRDLSLLMPEDFVMPVTTQRARRKKRAAKKPKRENEGKYTIEWADLKPKSRNYYNGLLLKKLTKPQTRWAGSQLQWRDF